MARTRITATPALKSWEDVDAALRAIAEERIELGDILADLNRQIIGAKAVAELESKPHSDHIFKLERDIQEFVAEHREDLGKAKNKALNFGEVGYRLSTSVSVPVKPDKLADVIRMLKARSMTDCIVVKETVDKVTLKKYGEDTVNAVGATWKQKDEFGYDVYVEKLERQAAGQR